MHNESARSLYWLSNSIGIGQSGVPCAAERLWDQTSKEMSDHTQFSSNKSYLFVLNAQAVKIAQFKAQDVKYYWIEASPMSSLDKAMTDLI